MTLNIDDIIHEASARLNPEVDALVTNYGLSPDDAAVVLAHTAQKLDACINALWDGDVRVLEAILVVASLNACVIAQVAQHLPEALIAAVQSLNGGITAGIHTA